MVGHLPLNALRVFEAAARHLSFRNAAEELHVTPAAVSQQIRTLEDQLGVQLFHRQTRSLKLTAAGKAGLPLLLTGFDHIHDAVRKMTDGIDTRRLDVWMAPSFASKWLMPRMHRFVAQHPTINLRISASSELTDTSGQKQSQAAENLREHDIDVAIRFGKGDYPGCHTDKLMAVSATPLCIPALMNDPDRPLREPNDLRHHTLLHEDQSYTDNTHWSKWLEAVGAADVDDSQGLHFNQITLALEAANAGQGVVMTLEQLAGPDLAAGRLVAPFERRLFLDSAYYAVSLPDSDNKQNIEAFRRWIIAETLNDARSVDAARGALSAA